jgi:hypothetical protein
VPNSRVKVDAMTVPGLPAAPVASSSPSGPMTISEVCRFEPVLIVALPVPVLPDRQTAELQLAPSIVSVPLESACSPTMTAVTLPLHPDPISRSPVPS